MYNYDGYYTLEKCGVHSLGTYFYILIGMNCLSSERDLCSHSRITHYAHLVKSVDSLHHLKFEWSKFNSLFLCGVMAITN